MRQNLQALLAYNGYPAETGALTLERGDAGAGSYLDLHIPNAAPIQFLLTSYQIRAEDLVRGEEIWDDGRLTIEWADGQGTTQSDYLSSIDGNALYHSLSVVNHPRTSPATPMLRLENRGISGSVILDKLVLFPVEETWAWRYGRWALISGWLLWAGALAGVFQRKRLKACCAAGIWVVVGTQLAFPGPWHNDRPWGSTFELTPPPDPSQLPSPMSSAHVEPSPPLDIPDRQGSPLLQIKAAFAKLRPILHLGLFFLPALAFLFLTSRLRAIALASSLAVGTELAQLGFGFGFDFTDITDLATDALGISSAVLTHLLWVKFAQKRRKSASA